MKTLQKFQQKNPKSELSKKACSYLKGGEVRKVKKGGNTTKSNLGFIPPPGI